MTTSPTAPTSAPRVRNARGQGSRLRAEIVEAARALLQDGTAETLSLRAVARAAGITAPSIYRHFPDVDAIARAVVDEAFDELEADLRAALEHGDAPGAPARVCHAYLTFAACHPQRYRLMFGGVWIADTPGADAAELAERAAIGQHTFTVLVEAMQHCVAAGASSSTDVVADAGALWVAMHGLADLRRTASLFPFPAHLEGGLVGSLARLSSQ